MSSRIKARRTANRRPGAGSARRPTRPGASAQRPDKPQKSDGRVDPRTMPPVLRWMWLNGLALAAFFAFVVFAVMQSVFGWQVRNEELMQAGSAGGALWQHLGARAFCGGVF